MAVPEVRAQEAARRRLELLQAKRRGLSNLRRDNSLGRRALQTELEQRQKRNFPVDGVPLNELNKYTGNLGLARKRRFDGKQLGLGNGLGVTKKPRTYRA